MYKNNCIKFTEGEPVNFTDDVLEDNRTLIIQPLNCPPYLKL